MRRWVMLFAFAAILSGCATYQHLALSDIEKGACLEYKEGMKWEAVTASLKDADFYPDPEPGAGPGLSKNARAYKGATVIFYVEPKAIIVDGKKRYEEVVYKLKVCKEK
ncbi:MAG: hypothetical protein HY790_00770 [Deltaproteobacteria bacterium]|nr:hypothetical protein [Deltaproteobacteria bacterium]